MQMKSPPRIFGLKDPIVLTGQQVPAGATHAAPAGTVWARLRALRAVYKILFEQFTFLMCGGAIRSPGLLGVASTTVVFLWNRLREGRSGTDAGTTETEPVRVQEKSLKNVPASGLSAQDNVQSPQANAMSAKEATRATLQSKGSTCQS
jgi:hypothetical protein